MFCFLNRVSAPPSFGKRTRASLRGRKRVSPPFFFRPKKRALVPPGIIQTAGADDDDDGGAPSILPQSNVELLSVFGINCVFASEE